MTREEALRHFKEQLDIFGGEHAEAIDMAIEALSEETSTIQEKHQLSEETPTNTSTKSTNISTNASADRPRGYWIGDKCSVCGEERAWYGSNPPICPDCGADMRGDTK